MKQNKLIFVGPVYLKGVPYTGDAVKNQLFLNRFKEVFGEVIPIDTYKWKRRPWVLAKLLLTVLLNNNSKIVISANSGSANKIIRYLWKLHLGNKLYYWVIGGSFHKKVKNGQYKAEIYKIVQSICVEGYPMVKTLNECGLYNVKYVPNSKFIDFIPTKPLKRDAVTHFVFLSRLDEHKGCNEIIAAVELLKQRGYEGSFDVTFYGKTAEKISYYDRFCQAILPHNEISYKGFLNLIDTNNYNELASYDVMLFPTYYEGEGFPGVIIDAYIAGIPVIATDWNLNRDVVEEGKTGWIIPIHNIEALAEKMSFVIEHPETVRQYSKNSSETAMKYDIRNVLSIENLKGIGLL